MYYAKGASMCHRADQLLVRSRKEFVSKNCLACGAPDYVRLEELPEIPCPRCKVALTIKTIRGTGYVCRCDQCHRSWTLASMLPVWSDHFKYQGLAAYGDGRFM